MRHLPNPQAASALRPRALLALCLALAAPLALAQSSPPASKGSVAKKPPATTQAGQASQQTREMQQGIIEFEQQTRQIQDDAGTGKVLKKVNLHSKDLIVRAMQDVANYYIDARNRYMAELQVVDLDRALAPDRIKQDTDMAESKKMFAEAKTVLARYVKTINDRQAMYAIANKLGMSERDKREFVLEVDQTLDEKGVLQQQLLDMEKGILDQIETTAMLLAENRNGWQFENRKILFADTALMTRYNTELGKVQQLSEEQDALRKKNFEDSRKNLKQMKEQLKTAP